MIKFITNIALATIAAASIVAASHAASPNPPKPKCPMGQIAVLKTDHWVCQAPSIKAQTKPGMENSTQAKDKMAVKKPARAKADLIVYSAEKSNTDATVVVVHIQNIGATASNGGKVQVKLADGTTADADMPNINPNQIRLVYVKFRSKLDKTRATVTADSTNVVPESNENNNDKVVTL